MPAATSTARLEARISTDLHSMLKRAAELQGRTMTDFVVAAVQDAAQRAIEQAEVIRLSLADQECFAQALLSPPQPAPALERAFARRRKLLRAESSSAPFRLTPLDAAHARAAFNCGSEPLERYLREQVTKMFAAVWLPASWRWRKGSASRATTRWRRQACCWPIFRPASARSCRAIRPSQRFAWAAWPSIRLSKGKGWAAHCWPMRLTVLSVPKLPPMP